MIKGLFCRYSQVWVICQHLLNKVLSIRRYFFPLWSRQRVCTQFHTVQNLLIIISIERWFSREQYVQDYTNAPNITFLIIIRFQYFRCYIVCCSVYLVHFLIRLKLLRCTEINYLNLIVVLGVHQNILWFKVSMTNVLCMTVLNC